MKHTGTQLIAIGSIFILLSACTSTPVQVVSTQTDTAAVEITNAVEPTVTSTQISPILTTTAEIACPKINPGFQFNLPIESSEFESAIQNYLDEGGNPDEIEAVASASEIQSFFALSSDLDGDLLPEVVITRDLSEQPATLYIFRCGQGNYQLVKSFSPDGISFSIPEFTTTIFESESPFMVIRAGRIAGWGQDFLALGWHNSEWQMIHLATGTTPAEIALFDQNADGTKEVFIKTRTAATPGGGKSRVVVDSYSWDGKEFVFTRSKMPPGNDRVHFLEDAEIAWKNGNPLLAISNYEIAARDNDLSSYWTTYELGHNQTELAKPYQQAFAFFRIVAIWSYLDRPDVASEYLQEMSEAFPNETPGNEFVQAAQALSDSYNNEPNFSQSCAQAVNLLDSQYPDIVQIHLGDWGVANPVYSATSDICELE